MTAQDIGLRSKVLTSTKLTTLLYLSTVGTRLISTVVLTRLLAPEIYGVFAVVMVYLYVLAMFSDLGIRSLIVSKEGEIEDDFLRTCWTVSILRGIVICLLCCGVAGLIFVLQGLGVPSSESPYAAPDLPWALAALGVMMIITGVQSPMIFMQERNMAFGKVTALEIAMNIIGLVITIVLAIYLRSIWALVLGNFARNLLQVTLGFMLFRGPPMRLCLKREHLTLVIDRGKWIVGHSALTAITQSGDRLILGLIMSSSTFGFYFIARQLVDIVHSFLMSLDKRMGIQVFTHLLKSDKEAFRRNYYKFRFFFDAVSGLSAGGLMVLAPLVVQILFDDRYQGVAPIAQVLIWGVVLVGPLLLRSALIAERRFKEMTLLSAVSAVTLWVGLLISVFVFESTEMGLMVIALHRLPEAMICTLRGGDRDWVIIWREFISFGFCAVGALIGWGLLEFWTALT